MYLISNGVFLQATAEANNLSAVAEAKETYSHLMDSVCGGSRPYLSTAALEEEHHRIKDKSMELFTSKRKMGGTEFSEKYREKLEQVLTLYLFSYCIFCSDLKPIISLTSNLFSVKMSKN